MNAISPRGFPLPTPEGGMMKADIGRVRDALVLIDTALTTLENSAIPASEAVRGVVALAALQAAITGTETGTAVTPAGLKAALDKRFGDFVGNAPAAVDTVYELAAALGNDANFSTTVMNLIGTKVSQATFEAVIAALSVDWIAESATRVFVSPAQRTDIGALRAEMNAIKAGSPSAFDTFAEVATALAGKLDASAKATAAQAKAGTATDAWMTPAATADAIGALSSATRYENGVVLTTSQTWTAPVKCKMRVRCTGGAGSSASVRGYGVNDCRATGGAAGGTAIKSVGTVAAGVQFTVTIGAGGAQSNTGFISESRAVNGTAGGVSSFAGQGINLVANGGEGGKGSFGTPGTTAGAVGGTASGGDFNYQGGGSGSVTTTGGNGASGGGSPGLFGPGFASGNVTVGSGRFGASGGASTGGGSGNVTANTSDAGSGGGGAGGPSQAAINEFTSGGPNLAGVAGNSGSYDAAAFGSLRGLVSSASGWPANLSAGQALNYPTGPGAATGGTVSYNSIAGASDFAGSGGVVAGQQYAYTPTPGFGAGQGGVVNPYSAQSGIFGSPGRSGFVVIEWTPIP